MIMRAQNFDPKPNLQYEFSHHVPYLPVLFVGTAHLDLNFLQTPQRKMSFMYAYAGPRLLNFHQPWFNIRPFKTTHRFHFMHEIAPNSP